MGPRAVAARRHRPGRTRVVMCRRQLRRPAVLSTPDLEPCSRGGPSPSRFALRCRRRARWWWSSTTGSTAFVGPPGWLEPLLGRHAPRVRDRRRPDHLPTQPSRNRGRTPAQMAAVARRLRRRRRERGRRARVGLRRGPARRGARRRARRLRHRRDPTRRRPARCGRARTGRRHRSPSPASTGMCCTSGRKQGASGLGTISTTSRPTSSWPSSARRTRSTVVTSRTSRAPLSPRSSSIPMSPARASASTRDAAPIRRRSWRSLAGSSITSAT